MPNSASLEPHVSITPREQETRGTAPTQAEYPHRPSKPSSLPQKTPNHSYIPSLHTNAPPPEEALTRHNHIPARLVHRGLPPQRALRTDSHLMPRETKTAPTSHARERCALTAQRPSPHADSTPPSTSPSPIESYAHNSASSPCPSSPCHVSVQRGLLCGTPGAGGWACGGRVFGIDGLCALTPCGCGGAGDPTLYWWGPSGGGHPCTRRPRHHKRPAKQRALMPRKLRRGGH